MITCVHSLVRMRWVPHHLEAACQIALEKTPVTVVSDGTDTKGPEGTLRDPKGPEYTHGLSKVCCMVGKNRQQKSKEIAQSKYSTSHVRSSTKAHQKSAHPSCYLERLTFGKTLRRWTQDIMDG